MGTKQEITKSSMNHGRLRGHDIANWPAPPWHDLDVCKIHISQHAKEQFAARGAKFSDDAHAEVRLRRNLFRAQEVLRRNNFKILLKYGVKPTRYFMWRGWIYVLVEGTLTTCYQGQLKNFTRIDGTSF